MSGDYLCKTCGAAILPGATYYAHPGIFCSWDCVPSGQGAYVCTRSSHPAMAAALTEDDAAQAKAELDAIPSDPPAREPEPTPPELHETITLDRWRAGVAKVWPNPGSRS